MDNLNIGQASPYQEIGQPKGNLGAFEGKITPTLPKVGESAANRTDKIFEDNLEILKKMASDIKSIQQRPLWEGLSKLKTWSSEEDIAKNKADISALEAKLASVKEKVESKKQSLKPEEFERLSQEYSSRLMELHSLKEASQKDEKLNSPEFKSAVRVVKLTQSYCQELDILSRHDADINEYTPVVKKILPGHIKEIEEKLANEKRNPPELQNTAIIKILEEAAGLLRSTLQTCRGRIEDHNRIFAPWNMDKKRAFEANRKALCQDLRNSQVDVQRLQGEESTPEVLRLTFSKKFTFNHHLSTLVDSITKLDKESAVLLNKAVKGTATEKERRTIETIQSRLRATNDHYKALQLTIGERASENQFRERAICATSIKTLEQRVNILHEILGPQLDSFHKELTNVTTQLNIFSNEKKNANKRAQAFYDACSAFVSMEKNLDLSQMKDPVAKEILTSKMDQFRSQLETAANSILTPTSPSLGQEKKWIDDAVRKANTHEAYLTEQDAKNVMPFLIIAMTWLTMLKPSSELQKRTQDTVAQCLDRMLQADKKNPLLQKLLPQFGQIVPEAKIREIPQSAPKPLPEAKIRRTTTEAPMSILAKGMETPKKMEEVGAYLNQRRQELQEINDIRQAGKSRKEQLLQEQRAQQWVQMQQYLNKRNDLIQEGLTILQKERRFLSPLETKRLQTEQLKMDTGQLTQQLAHVEQQQKLDIEILGKIQEKQRSQEVSRQKQNRPRSGERLALYKSLSDAQNAEKEQMIRDYEKGTAPLRMRINQNMQNIDQNMQIMEGMKKREELTSSAYTLQEELVKEMPKRPPRPVATVVQQPTQQSPLKKAVVGASRPIYQSRLDVCREKILQLGKDYSVLKQQLNDVETQTWRLDFSEKRKELTKKIYQNLDEQMALISEKPTSNPPSLRKTPSPPVPEDPPSLPVQEETR